jgi:hypothetical protein
VIDATGGVAARKTAGPLPAGPPRSGPGEPPVVGGMPDSASRGRRACQFAKSGLVGVITGQLTVRLLDVEFVLGSRIEGWCRGSVGEDDRGRRVSRVADTVGTGGTTGTAPVCTPGAAGRWEAAQPGRHQAERGLRRRLRSVPTERTLPDAVGALPFSVSGRF